MTKAWIDNLSALFERPLEFFPARFMTPEERLNASVRFVLYATAAAYAYSHKDWFLYFALGSIILITGLYIVNRKKKETFSAMTPSPENPFMNVVGGEGVGQICPKPLLDPSTKEGSERVDKAFAEQKQRQGVFYEDPSMRGVRDPFLSLPCSGGLPDTHAFARSLIQQ